MRLARVLLAESGAPRLALERDGCLYDVETLEERFETRFSPARLPQSGDFHTRVAALALAGLDDLDDRLKRGDRPSEARLPESELVWLAPFDTDRVLLIEAETKGAAPGYRIGNGRGVLGQSASISFPDGESRPQASLAVAVMIGDDLSRASHARSRDAVVAYSIANTWTARATADRCRAQGRSEGPARDFGAQIGPVLVTRDEVGAFEGLRVQLRVEEGIEHDGGLGLSVDDVAEAIAFTSQYVDLRSGDVFAVPLEASGIDVPFGTRVDVLIERFGKLSGRPVQGPPSAWRRGT